MNILEEMLGPQGGELVDSLSKQFGLDENDTRKAMGSMLPSLTKSLQDGLQQEDKGSVILSQLQRGNHERYWERPAELQKKESVDAGNDILDILFGSKDHSRKVAGQAADATGIDVSILKKMLPELAGAAMGGLKVQARDKGVLEEVRQGRQPSGDVLGGLTKYLDFNHDGSMMDDIMGMVAKFLR